MKRLSPRCWLVGLALVTVTGVLLGCRTPIVVEGDLDIEPFESPMASLTQDPSGQWYALAAQGGSPGPYLTVEYEGKTHLFAAGRQGERSARILPLSRVDARWLEAAARDDGRIEFHDDLSQLYTDTTLGKWAGGDDEAVRWLGPEPASPMRAVAFAVEHDQLASVSLPSHIQGTVEVDRSGVLRNEDGLTPGEGPYLLIPDGPITRSGPRAASLVGVAIDEDVREGWSWEQLAGQPVANDADLREMAGRLTVEVLVARQGDDVRIGFAADGGAPVQHGVGGPVALAESGLVVDGAADEAERSTILRAVDDLYKDHPLSAAYRLHQVADKWSVDGHRRATMLRHQDLVAAGGYLQWMAATALDGVDGVGPEVSLYAARAFGYDGDWESAEAYAQRAIRLFSDWPRQPAAIGMARTRLVLSEIQRMRGAYDEAQETLRWAADDYLRADDPYRAALATRRHLVRGGAGDYEAVARRLEDAGAHYEASRTILLAAAADIADGDLDGAHHRLQSWTDRWASRASTGLLLLARGLRKRLQWLTTGDIDSDELVDSLERAQQLHAWEALITLALTQHAWRAMYDDIDIRRIGQWLVEGTLRSDSPIFGDEIDRTLGVVCSDVVFSAGDRETTGVFEQQCHRRIDESLATAEGVESVLAGGYRFVQRGELDAARDLEQSVFGRIEDRQESEWAMARARGYLYRAALAGESHIGGVPDTELDGGDPVAEAIQEAFEIMADNLAGDEAPAMLRSLGTEFDARGFDRLTLALHEASMMAAIDAGQSSDEYEAALALAEARYRAGAWTPLAEMDNVESPLHAARIDLYRGHAEAMRENHGNAATHFEQGLSQAAEFGVRQQVSILRLVAQMALERGAYEACDDYLRRALAILVELPTSRANTDRLMALGARVWALDSRLALAEGARDDALKKARTARVLAEDLPVDAFAEAHLDVLSTAAIAAEDTGEFRDVMRDFDEFNRVLPEGVDLRLQRDVVRELASFSIDDGEQRQALNRIRSVIGEGIGLDLRRQRHHCVVGTTRLFVALDGAARYHIERCVGLGPESASAANAEFLLALADPEVEVSYRVGLIEHLQNHLDDPDSGEHARLEWMRSWSQPHTEEAAPDGDEIPKVDNGDDVADTEHRLEAAVEFAEGLLDRGQYAQADKYLRSEASVFFEPDVDAEAQWVELRLTSMARQLRPFDVFDYADRLLEEDVATTDTHRGRAHYFRAVAHLQLRQIFSALRSLERARKFAAPDSGLERALDALESTVETSRFGP